MAKFGSKWTSAIDESLQRTLRNRARRSQTRLYLGSENESELIWQTTHGDLLQLLGAPAVAPLVEELTGTKPLFLRAKLDEIREIRNVLAHNRALSVRTQTILAGLLASLEECVGSFKRSLLYASGEIMSDETSLGGRLETRRQENLGSVQAFVAERGAYFIEYVALPNHERAKDWPDAEILLRAYKEHLSSIVAFLLK